MFSSRLAWDLPSNRLTQLLERKRAAGARILDLTESNPTRAGFRYPDGILDALTLERSLEYEPSPRGSEAARREVCGYYQSHGCRIEPDRILLTASTSEAYSYLFKLLANPQEAVLAPRPSYPLFGFLAALETVQVVEYPLSYNHGWWIDFDELERRVSDQTRAIVVVNPNNPTGSFLKRDEFHRLAALGVPIICDEVFTDYSFRPDEQRVSTLAGQDEVLSFSLSGLSKVCGLPQLKLGWMVVNGPAGERRRAMERLELIADTYLSVATPVQHALPRLLESGAAVRAQITARVSEQLAYLGSNIRRAPACRLLDVEGGWYATIQAPRIRSEEEWVLELLEQDDVLVQPGFFYDFESEAYLVVSLLTDPSVFREGLARMLGRLQI